jgi:hypothetical protein
MFRLFLIFGLLTTCCWSESVSGLPPLIPRNEEIALAESAGPPGIAKNATIYVLERGIGYTIARKGANGFACFVHRDRADTLEPECFDPAGVESLMQPEIDRAKYREEGMSPEQADAKIDNGFASGLYRVPRRTAITYMLSTKNKVFNGKSVIEYPPHIMISAPYVKNADIGADFKDPAMPWVLNEGSPRAYIMVVVGKSGGKNRPGE